MGRSAALTGLLPVSLLLVVAHVGRHSDVRRDVVMGIQERDTPSRQEAPDPAATSPKSCGRCHPFIYGRWSRGMHRYSFEDPIFQAAYARVYLESAGRAANTCLRCHAPMAYVAGDLEVKNPVNRQGVQCGFCHTVEAVDLSRRTTPFRRRPGTDLASPHREVGRTDDHGVFYQPLLHSARFCAGCHEYVVEGDVHIVSTFSEWKAGPYPAEGKTCQSCHMPGLKKVVSKDGSVRELNDHDLSGGHSSVQVRKAGRVTIRKVERRGEELTVRALVENIGSGHCLPTGMPSRRLVLEVEILARGRVVDRDHRTYRKVVADAEGRELITDGDIKWHGRRILRDNRLRPREQREEVFHFRVDPGSSYEVRASLTYSYTPLLLKREPIRIRIGVQTKHVAGNR